MSVKKNFGSTSAALRTMAYGLAGGSVLVGALGVSNSPAHATYAQPWSRQNAYDLGVTGINEAYDPQAVHSVWNDNNVWDELGADCSGYANKVWAVFYQRAIGYDDHGAGGTATWWGLGVDGSVNITLADTRPLKMDTWVQRRSNNTGHMGMFEGTRDANSNYKVWEAASATTGIRNPYKAPSFFQQSTTGGVTTYAAKRFKRANW